jgi:hypothetical protein
MGRNFFLFGGQKGVFPDLLATSGDYLRVWRAAEPETRLECVLNNVSYSFVHPEGSVHKLKLCKNRMYKKLLEIKF